MPETSQPHRGVLDIDNADELLLPTSLLNISPENLPEVPTQDTVLSNLIRQERETYG